MSKLLIAGAIGVGGYLLYEWWQNQQLVSSVSQGTTIATGSVQASSTVVNTPINNNPSLVKISSLTASQILNVAQVGASQMYTASQWNYYITMLTGIPGPNLGDNGSPMDVMNYLNLLQKWGTANGMGRLGMVVNLDIYKNRKPASGFGDSEFLAALGKGLGMLVNDSMNNAAYIDQGPMTEAAAFSGSNTPENVDFYLAVANQGNIYP